MNRSISPSFSKNSVASLNCTSLSNYNFITYSKALKFYHDLSSSKSKSWLVFFTISQKSSKTLFKGSNLSYPIRHSDEGSIRLQSSKTLPIQRRNITKTCWSYYCTSDSGNSVLLIPILLGSTGVDSSDCGGSYFHLLW